MAEVTRQIRRPGTLTDIPYIPTSTYPFVAPNPEWHGQPLIVPAVRENRVKGTVLCNCGCRTRVSKAELVWLSFNGSVKKKAGYRSACAERILEKRRKERDESVPIISATSAQIVSSEARQEKDASHAMARMDATVSD